MTQEVTSPLLTRRKILALAAAGLCAPLPACLSGPDNGANSVAPNVGAGPSDAVLLADLQARTFNYFWETAHPQTGLVPDRWPARSDMCSVAAVGFAVTAYIVGVEEGLITREQARQRVLLTARFLAAAQQGPQSEGTSGHQGFFYHFLNMQTGHRFNSRVELSSIDTALLMMGLLHAQAYFDQDDRGPEAEIRALIEGLYRRVNWPWMQQRKGLLCMGWNPETGFATYSDYKGYDEASFLYLLALGSPTFAVAEDAWTAFTATYDAQWGSFMGQEHLAGAPLFFHQYTQVWIDFRGMQDAYMRRRGMDYFENSRRATLSQQAYAISNPGNYKDYGARVWGLTACDGPGTINGPDYQGKQRQYFDYRARGAALTQIADDGTIAPTAALSSLPFAPEIVLPTLRALRERFGDTIYSRYGFLDAFNTSFRAQGAPLSDGRYAEGFGWVASDYIGIDQGPILAMTANYRKGTVWRTMRRSPHILRGLQRAGFQGGWLG